jgi:outer membrane protein insertion porin family
MFKLFLILFTFFLLFISPLASENFTDTLVNGNERISKKTIILFSEIPEVKSLDENSLNLILKKLYKTGFFKDVAVAIEDNQLIIDVVENPIIQTIFIEGIKNDKIKKSIYEVLSLKDRSSFNIDASKNDETSIINNLKDKG